MSPSFGGNSIVTREEFDAFFRGYAKNVDTADQQYFWKLSDALILEILRRNIPDAGAEGIILDAGGGTARWAIRLSRSYASRFCVYDLSPDMLTKARENISAENLEDRIRLQEGDLTDMRDIGDESIDHITSIYSPISFIPEKEKAVRELFRILRPKGRILLMGHGYFNAIASKINNYHAPVDELRDLERDSLVKWAPGVPALNVFSKESMEQLLRHAGFTPLTTFGVPVFVQPGPEDFDPENKRTSGISKALADKAFFEAIFALEMKHNAETSVADRGVNIFALAEKI